MEEILHQLVGSLSRYLQGFIDTMWSFRISSITSIITFAKRIYTTFLVPIQYIRLYQLAKLLGNRANQSIQKARLLGGDWTHLFPSPKTGDPKGIFKTFQVLGGGGGLVGRWFAVNLVVGGSFW